MTRQQLEHVLRAAGAVARVDRLVVVGSQAVLGQHPDAPLEMLVSMEADLYAPDLKGASDLIDGSIGEGSPFHQAFGYHAHGVGPDTATLPRNWERRHIKVSSPATAGVVGLCPEAHDLGISKLVAGRPKDVEFVTALVRHRMVDGDTLRERLAETVLDAVVRKACQARLERLLAPA